MSSHLERQRGWSAWKPRRWFYSASLMPSTITLGEPWAGPAICGWTFTKRGAVREVARALVELNRELT